MRSLAIAYSQKRRQKMKPLSPEAPLEAQDQSALDLKRDPKSIVQAILAKNKPAEDIMVDDPDFLTDESDDDLYSFDSDADIAEPGLDPKAKRQEMISQIMNKLGTK